MELQICDGLALGDTYYYVNITDDGNFRKCWIRANAHAVVTEVLPGSHTDDGDTLDWWHPSNPGDWVGRELVVWFEHDDDGNIITDEGGIPKVKCAGWMARS